MRYNHKFTKYMPAVMTGLALAFSASLAKAAVDIIPPPAAMEPGGTNTDTCPRFGVWWCDDTNVTHVTATFDTSKQSQPDIAGSIHFVWDCATNGTANTAFGNFFDWTTNSGWLGQGKAHDAAEYGNLSLDLYFDQTVSSNVTSLPFYLWGSLYNNEKIADIPTSVVGWFHTNIPISSTIAISNCTAYGPYLWNAPNSHLEYWMDNVKWTARPLVPPTMSIAKFGGSTGLMLTTAPADGGGARQSIYTTNSVYWYNRPGMSYSMTIASLPDYSTHPGMQCHIFIVAGVPTPVAATADWTYREVVFLQVTDTTDGMGIGRFMWKTNEPNGNYMLFNEQFGGPYGTNGYAAGTLGMLAAPTALGTWTLTFTANTAVTLTGPGGVSTNFDIPAAWVQSFNSIASRPGAIACFGMQPQADSNAGQAVYLSHVQVAQNGVTYNGWEDNFTAAPLNPMWGKAAADPGAILVVPPDTAYWVNWTQPANSFVLQSYTAVTSPRDPFVWTDVPAVVSTWGAVNHAPVVASALPSSDTGFFQLQQRLYQQLQVLLPGETAAPGTPTGKTGTADHQKAGEDYPFMFTVNGTDGLWHTAVDPNDSWIWVQCDPTNAIFSTNPQRLVNGTANFAVVITNTGTFTITAIDTTPPAGRTITNGIATVIVDP